MTELDLRDPAPGVRRFTVPLALPSPDHLHVHVLETPAGPLIVDVGARGSEAGLQAGLEALSVDSNRVLVTHGHIDHWGIATTITDRILSHPGIDATFRFMSAETADRDPVQARMLSAFDGFLGLSSGIPEVDPIGEGDRFGDWEVLFTPGHDPGHVCLYRAGDGVLLCGDVLLPGYTPNVQPAPDGSDALADFLGSLARLADLEINLVLPSHGEPYADGNARARELIAFHEARLETLREAMRGGSETLRDLRDATFSVADRDRGDRMLAAMETFAHLDHLGRRGEAQMSPDGRWTLVGG
jgi:glyoxylase-like metal-dependent hydrolase (beta-lactamase superfamily II)